MRKSFVVCRVGNQIVRLAVCRETRAVRAATDRFLYVLNPQHGWIPAGTGASARIARSLDHTLWIYAVVL